MITPSKLIKATTEVTGSPSHVALQHHGPLRAGLIQGPLSPERLFGMRFPEVLNHQQSVCENKSRFGPILTTTSSRHGVKKRPHLRPILDLRVFNKSVATRKFRMLKVTSPIWWWRHSRLRGEGSCRSLPALGRVWRCHGPPLVPLVMQDMTKGSIGPSVLGVTGYSLQRLRPL